MEKHRVGISGERQPNLRPRGPTKAAPATRGPTEGQRTLHRHLPEPGGGLRGAEPPGAADPGPPGMRSLDP